MRLLGRWKDVAVIYSPSLFRVRAMRHDNFAAPRRNAHASFRSLNASSTKSGFNESLETDDYGSLPKSISLTAQVHRMRLMLKQMIYLIHFGLRITASHQMWRTRCFHFDSGSLSCELLTTSTYCKYLAGVARYAGIPNKLQTGEQQTRK